jgi:hypothetical protein
MKSKLLISLFTILSVIALTSGVKKVDHVAGYSGGGTGCSCHGSAKYAPTNIFMTGIPKTVIVTATGGKKFGMNISTGATGGTFTTTNTYAKITSSKYAVEHVNPPAANNTYTWSNINWIAPATAGRVTFKYVGIAGSGTSGSSAVGVYRDTFGVDVVVATPVTFSKFTVEKVNKNIAISWSTASESSVDHFEIEKSTDGKEFTTLTSLKSKGNTTVGNNYIFMDKLNGYADFIYYRIKSVDLNGAVTYSETRTVSNKPIKELSIYPNPAKRSATINVGFTSIVNDIATIKMIDLKGSIICSYRKSVVTGDNVVCVETSKIATPGNYYVVVSFDNKVNSLIQSASIIVR